MGVRIQLVFVLVFAFGAGPCGHGGRRRRHVPVDLARRGHAVPARLARRRHHRRHGLDPGRGARRGHHRARRAIGSVYIPTYAIVLTFLIMVLVLAVRPQGLLAGR